MDTDVSEERATAIILLVESDQCYPNPFFMEEPLKNVSNSEETLKPYLRKHLNARRI
jgi:hypothetical protein